MSLTDVITAILQMFCKFSNFSSRSVPLLTSGQNVLNLPLLVNDFHLFCYLFSFDMPSYSYRVAQKDLVTTIFSG